MTLLLAAAMLLGPPALKTSCSSACTTRVMATERHQLRVRHARQCRQSKPVPCIATAARRYRVSFPTLLRKARCESQLNPYARNPSGASGLFQFLPSTWATTPYATHDIYSARYSALAAAWMHSRGRGGEWVCR